MNKKVYLCNRVVRSSKSQHISVLALSLNRYHKIETLLFCSDTQSDTTFLIIPSKDNASREHNKINLSVFYAEVRFIFAFGAKIRVFWRLIINY